MKEREVRSMELRLDEQENKEESFMVRGYASTFERYLLFKDGDNEYYEQIDPKAFDECDMSDVVLRVDHEGTVYARTSNKSLNLFVDDHGLGVESDLSRTEKAKGLYDDIRAGMYPKMSFAFTVDVDEYDKNTRTRMIKRVGKLYDVSPVSFPANPTTELDVATRDYFDGVIEAERAERLEAEKREKDKALLTLKLKLMED